MKEFKKQIQERLEKINWEIDSINEGTEWWLNEYWTIKTKIDPLKNKCFLLFKVDPLYEGNNKIKPTIVEIELFSFYPESRVEKKNLITTIDMRKRKFNSKLDEFILEFEEWINT